MARTRSAKNRDLPANLRVNNGYYSWEDPRPGGKNHGLGRDKKYAIQQAIEANLAIAGDLARVRLIDRLQDQYTGVNERTLKELMPFYEAALKERELKPVTVKEIERKLQLIAKTLGEYSVPKITTAQIVAFLKPFKDDGKGRVAQQYRSLLLELFNQGIAEGWCKTNPVEVTAVPLAKVRRERLTLETFKIIYDKAAALEPWVQNSIALGLVTAQRRGDIAKMKFEDVKEKLLWVDQGKENMRVRIPTFLRLKVLNWTVGEVIEKCKDSLNSEYMVHHIKKHMRVKPGDQIHVSNLSAAFAEARDLVGLKWPEGKEPPTYHELRSLSERLYKAQGIDTQILLGHKHAKTTALYHDSRGAEWLDVEC